MKKIIFVLMMILVFLLPYIHPQEDEQDKGVRARLKDLGANCNIGKQYLFLIAIDKYKNWKPLQYPVRETLEIKKILTTSYYINEVRELYNEEATLDNIVQCLNKLQKDLEVDDSLLIFFSGHGHLDPSSETGFWIPYDGGKLAMDGGIGNSVIRGIIKKMPAKHILIISDSCFAGSLLEIPRGSPPIIDNEYIKKIYSLRCRKVVTSGAMEYVPDKSEFADQLKLALKENEEPIMDELTLFNKIKLGVTKTLPLFGALQGTNHQNGAGFLLFLKEVPEKWRIWLENLKKRVKEAEEYEKNPSFTSSSRKEKREKILIDFPENCPFSLEDEELKKRVEQRIKDWTNRIEFEKYLELAQKHYEKGQCNRAYKYIKKAHRIMSSEESPELESHELEEQIIKCLGSCGKKKDEKSFKKALKKDKIEAYEEYLDRCPMGIHAVHAHFNCGVIYIKKNEYNKALIYFKDALNLNPDDADVHNNLGLCYMNRGQYEKSRESFDKAIKLYQSQWEAMKKAGLKKKDEKKIKEKIAIVYNNQGVSWIKGDHDEKKNKKAFDYFNKAIQLNPKYSNAYYNLGLYDLQKKIYENAILDFKEAIGLSGKDTTNYEKSEIYEELAKAYRKAGYPEKAKEANQKAKNLKHKR